MTSAEVDMQHDNHHDTPGPRGIPGRHSIPIYDSGKPKTLRR